MLVERETIPAPDGAAAAPRMVDLQEAAAILGVHYQTAYKWVRAGTLPAEVVKGRYRIEESAVRDIALRREQPARPPARRPRGGYRRAAERVFAMLRDGEERAVRELVAGLRESGVALTTIMQEVLAPALAKLGEEWGAGRLEISVEHRASAAVERILGEQSRPPRGRRRGTATVAAVDGERHSLPALMAALALREDNWHVHHLGADLPAEELLRFCEQQPVDLAVLTVTQPDRADAATRTAAELASAGVRALVGAPGATLEQLQAQARAQKATA